LLQAIFVKDLHPDMIFKEEIVVICIADERFAEFIQNDSARG